MRSENTNQALGLPRQPEGVINIRMAKWTWLSLTALLSLLGLAVHAAEAKGKELPAAIAPVTASAGATNSPLATIQRDLQNVRSRIDATVKQVQNAVASNPKTHANKVLELANQIRDVASKDLADDGQIVKGAESLIAKIKDSVAKSRAMGSNPNVRSRDVYTRVQLKLERELAELIDARASVERIRFELLTQADGLAGDAEAIAFAADADEAILASETFKKCLGEVVQFTQHLELMISNIGKDQKLAAN